jgi:hypothetical protein
LLAVATARFRQAGRAMKKITNQKAAKADNRSVKFNKADRAEMLADAKAKCKEAGIRPTEGNLRRVITDELGAAVATQLFGGKSDVVRRNGRSAATPKATPKAKPVKAARKLGAIFGHSMIAVARALGKAGLKPAAAVAAIHKHEPTASVAAIRTFVYCGRHGLRGAPAPLSKKQLKELAAVA